ncbi:MAG: O-antigen ligase family protein [Bryobacteraceae bacterium]
MRIVAPAVVALVALAIAPGLLFGFDITPKVVVILVGAALALPLAANGLPDLWRTRLGRWFLIVAAVQCGSLILATAWSSHGDLSLGGTNWRRFGAVTQIGIVGLAGCVAATPGIARGVLRAATASGAVAAAYGVAQYFGWDPLIPASAYHVGEGEWTIVRPPGTMGYVTYFGNYLVHVVFFGLATAGRDESRRWRMSGSIAAATAAVAIVLSGTRAAMLGLAAGAVLWLWSRRPSLGPRLVAACAIALALAAAFYLSPAGLKLRARARWIAEDPRGGARIELWRDSLRMGAARWATGAGIETFSSEFPRHQSAELARAYPEFYYESPHNIFLDAWTAQGVFGVVALAALGAVGLAGAPWGRPVLVASLVAHQFGVFTAPTALIFWVTVAILVAAESPARRPPVSLATLPISLLLAAFALRLAAAEWLLERVKRSLVADRIVEAQQAYATFRRVKPIGVSADLWYSRALADAVGKSADVAVRLKSWPQAADAARRATATDENRASALYNYAVFLGVQNDATGTEQALRRAIEAAPQWRKPREMLARVLAARDVKSPAPE